MVCKLTSVAYLLLWITEPEWYWDWQVTHPARCYSSLDDFKLPAAAATTMMVTNHDGHKHVVWRRYDREFFMNFAIRRTLPVCVNGVISRQRLSSTVWHSFILWTVILQKFVANNDVTRHMHSLSRTWRTDVVNYNNIGKNLVICIVYLSLLLTSRGSNLPFIRRIIAITLFNVKQFSYVLADIHNVTHYTR